MTDTPTMDELAGMAWCNALSESERAGWLNQAGTGVVADAWAIYKRQAASGLADEGEPGTTG